MILSRFSMAASFANPLAPTKLTPRHLGLGHQDGGEQGTRVRGGGGQGGGGGGSQHVKVRTMKHFDGGGIGKQRTQLPTCHTRIAL